MKTSELPVSNNIFSDDKILIVSNASEPSTAIVDVSTLEKYFISPFSANTTTHIGQLQFDTNFLYVTVANNVIKKIQLQTI